MDNKYIHVEKSEFTEAILIKYVQGGSSEEENARIAIWLKEDIGNEKILLQIAQIYYAQRTNERICNRNSYTAFDRVQHQKQKKTHRACLQRFLVFAACVALVGSVAINSFLFIQKEESQVPQYVTIETNAGMRTTMNLPDGTIVLLNSVTKLTYPILFDSKERRVALDGEAYFKVVHDSAKPFVVETTDKHFQVQVLGTEFNMRAYSTSQELKTTLIDGSIKLITQTEAGERKCMALNPSERAVYERNTGNLHVAEVNPSYDTAWMQGRLMFKDTPISEVLNQLSHFYNVTFETDNPAIKDYAFTGTFENRQLSQILDYLSISSRIDYRMITTVEDDSQGIKRTKIILTKSK